MGEEGLSHRGKPGRNPGWLGPKGRFSLFLSAEFFFSPLGKILIRVSSQTDSRVRTSLPPTPLPPSMTSFVYPLQESNPLKDKEAITAEMEGGHWAQKAKKGD